MKYLPSFFGFSSVWGIYYLSGAPFEKGVGLALAFGFSIVVALLPHSSKEALK